MQNLSEVLKQFQQQYANKASLGEIVESIGKDEDIRSFWKEHQNELKSDAFQLKMGDLYEYIQQKKKIAAGDKVLYPGYYPQLAIEKGYPLVHYVATEDTRKQLLQREKLTLYKTPKAIRQADWGNIGQEIIDHAQDEFGKTDAFLALDKILKNFTNGEQHSFVQGVYLYGNFGVGKTFMMGALANALAANNIGVMLLHFPSFISDLKATFDHKNESLDDLLSKAKTVPVLILDDIGADTQTAWSRDAILGIILEYRMQNELTTFFTSNFDMESFEEYLAQTKEGHEPVKAARLMQRVKFLAKPVSMTGKNRRLEN
ncbi:primosomal protein DnaI [Leuconostoc litchii]|uniref:Primosomal protein DnaI n=1 Tax=Leuconostoc litchii TaxID=1981069 RepID=A0A6P2CRA5_9LACO|nr:primosomal protein DnaI [Leuconostoc litchii]TYC47391.1 primosomal protein DnaI [Leuconostoc litchii]GMA69404.1 primosomal protein DnaI [Leuconostoc litchii]